MWTLHLIYSTVKQSEFKLPRVVSIHFCPFLLKCIWHEIFKLFLSESFQSDEEWHLFYCNSILGCRVIQDFDLCKLEDLWGHKVDTKWCKITKYGISVHILSLQGWCAARTTHCGSGYDVTIATYSLPDLYLPKMKNALFVVPESNGLFFVLVLCNVHIRSHPLNEQHEQITLFEGGKLWFYLLNGYSPEPTVLPWKCHSGHIMELCDECNNCTKFQFCTKKSSEIFHFLWFYIIFCPHCDATSHLICRNQNFK